MKKINPKSYRIKEVTSREWQRVSKDENLPLTTIKESFGEPELVQAIPFEGIRDFSSAYKSAREKITGEKTSKILAFAQAILPTKDGFQRGFAVFLNIKKITNTTLDVLTNNSLIHGYYGDFIIISAGTNSLSFYSSCIDFFYHFRSLINKNKDHHPIVLRELAKGSANRTFLIYSDTKGNGLLVKSLKDKTYGGGINRELDVMRIGKIIGANIPKNAQVIKNTNAPMFREFIGGGDIFIETLTPNSKSLKVADKNDFDEIKTYDGKNLAKLFLFDVIAGSWDRHAGNYLITTYKNKKTIQEIDFGLFQPSFFRPASGFNEDNDIFQKWPNKDSLRPGWAITCNSKVKKVILQTNSRDFIAGMKQGIRNLYKAIQSKEVIGLVAPVFYERARGLFQEGSPTQELFFRELKDIGYDNAEIIEYIQIFAI